MMRRLGAGFTFLLMIAACGPPPTGPLTRFLDPEFAVEVENNIVYATGAVRSPTVGEIDLLLDLYRPAGANLPPLHPGFILIHGGGFTGDRSKISSVMIGLANEYAQRGYVTASIDYRLVEDDPPTEDLCRNPENPVCVAFAAARVDASRAVEWMRANAAAYRIDPNRIAMGGFSAGAITTMGVAFRDPGVDGADVQVVLSLSGGLYGTDSIIDAGDPPLFMIHGTNDDQVPFRLAEAIETQARSVGLILEFHRLEGFGHNTPATQSWVIDGVTLGDRIANFFYAHLGLEAL